MDNITHSLIGYAVGAGITRKAKLTDSGKRAVIAASIMGNNFPDLDVLLTPFVRASDFPVIEQLVHHRGYTHTAIFTPLLALLAAFIARAAAKAPPSFRFLFGVALLGGLTHILADSWNEYGVHPFWPLDSRWYYGDFVFILEPLFWAFLGAFAFWDARNRAGRAFLALTQIGIVVAAWKLVYIPMPVAAVITFVFLASHALQRRYVSVRLALGLMGLMLAILGVGRFFAKSEVREAFAAERGGERIQQLITSPAPANPFCWRTLVVSVDETKDVYRVSLGGVSLLPALFDPGQCSSRWQGVGTRTASTRESSIASTSHVRWSGEYVATWSEWKRLASEDCAVSAFLRFARAPFIGQIDGARVYGDLRYDREPGLGFAEYAEKPGKCPGLIPGWGQPIFQ